jgi:hypothetical protein
VDNMVKGSVISGDFRTDVGRCGFHMGRKWSSWGMAKNQQSPGQAPLFLLVIYMQLAPATCFAATGASPTWLDWLMTPISGSSHSELQSAVYWHARVMVLAWAVLLPLGCVVARYFKVTRRQRWPEELDNLFWWRSHLRLQVGGIAFACLGLCLILLATPSRPGVTMTLHGLFGWIVMAMGGMQIAIGIRRGSKGGPTGVGANERDPATWRGDHYDMTAWRMMFERLHKSAGWLAVLLAIPTTVLGLLVADGPRWMLVVLSCWWSGLLIVCIRLQLLGRCVDTYQAIWGPDPVHPGNRMHPIGWGVQRLDRGRSPVKK